MDDHDIRWVALLPLPFVIGLAMLLFEVNGLWPGGVIRPDLVWCLVFFATRRSAAVNVLLASAWCGLARDLTLGPKLGAAALAYFLLAIAFLHLREWAAGGGFIDHAALFAALVVGVNLVKAALDGGAAFFADWSDNLIIAFGNSLATLVAYPLMYVLLAIPWIEPTRVRRRKL